MSDKKRAMIIYGVVGIVVLIAIGIWWRTGGQSRSNPIVDLSLTQTPPGITPDMILDKNAIVLRSYTTTLKGQPESALIYSSRESSGELYSAYIIYLIKASWSNLQLTSPNSGISSDVNTVPGSIQATNMQDTARISINILQDAASGVRTVILDVVGMTPNANNSSR